MESLHSFCVKAWIMIVGSKPEGIGYLVGLRAFFFFGGFRMLFLDQVCMGW